MSERSISRLVRQQVVFFESSLRLSCSAIQQHLLSVLHCTHITLYSQPPRTHAYLQAWLSLAALCDTTITCSMVFYLWIARKSTAIEETTTLLTRLIKLTVETGFVCTAVNMVSLIFLLKSRATFLYVVFVVVTSKLYSNCLLAVSSSLPRLKCILGDI